MTIKNWNIQEMTGYEPKTTFYTDFSIADMFGTAAVRDTLKSSLWVRGDAVMYTELVMVLNWKIWEHYESGNERLAGLYDELWRKECDWAYSNLKGKDLNYFITTTD